MKRISHCVETQLICTLETLLKTRSCLTFIMYNVFPSCPKLINYNKRDLLIFSTYIYMVNVQLAFVSSKLSGFSFSLNVINGRTILFKKRYKAILCFLCYLYMYMMRRNDGCTLVVLYGILVLGPYFGIHPRKTDQC